MTPFSNRYDRERRLEQDPKHCEPVDRHDLERTLTTASRKQ